MKLEIHNLSKSFGPQQVLRHLSLQVKEGEFVSILGPSGSGKSTLFHLIGGLYQPDEGEILLDGKLIMGERGHISYMPQQSALLPWRTILQNVLLTEELQGKSDPAKAQRMLAKAGLLEYANAYPHQLSGGMKQRASFIRALLSPQSLLLLDEPFSALDELTRMEMQQWLLHLWEEDRRSVLFITHSIEEALLLSDRIYILSPKPAQIEREIVIPQARPRTEAWRLSENFLELKREAYHTLAHHQLPMQEKEEKA